MSYAKLAQVGLAQSWIGGLVVAVADGAGQARGLAGAEAHAQRLVGRGTCALAFSCLPRLWGRA